MTLSGGPGHTNRPASQVGSSLTYETHAQPSSSFSSSLGKEKKIEIRSLQWLYISAVLPSVTRKVQNVYFAVLMGLERGHKVGVLWGSAKG